MSFGGTFGGFTPSGGGRYRHHRAAANKRTRPLTKREKREEFYFALGIAIMGCIPIILSWYTGEWFIAISLAMFIVPPLIWLGSILAVVLYIIGFE